MIKAQLLFILVLLSKVSLCIANIDSLYLDLKRSNSSKQAESEKEDYKRSSFFNVFFKEEDSAIYSLKREELQRGMIVFVNGLLNEVSVAKDHADYLSSLTLNKNIYYVHNATRGIILDVFDCLVSKTAFHKSVELIQKIWIDFLLKDSESSILVICHSQGVTLVKNALLDMRWEVRRRIIVVSIAGVCIIPDSLCQKAFNYISSRDFIPYLDYHVRNRDLEEIYPLTPMEGASLWDHEFQSPTYLKVLKYHIDEYLNNPRGYLD